MSNVPTGIAATKEWFARAVPKPTQKNIHTQTGVHLEEVAEFIASLHGTNEVTRFRLDAALQTLRDLSQHLKKNDDVLEFNDANETLDGLLDQIVTATGVAHMLNYDVVGGLDEVNRSNYSQFVDGQPLFDENRKIKKGPQYSRPDLTPYR